MFKSGQPVGRGKGEEKMVEGALLGSAASSRFATHNRPKLGFNGLTMAFKTF